MEGQERAARFRVEMHEAERASGVARRHEELIGRATDDEVLSIEEAEQVYALAEEESVEPAYGLALVRSGFLVQELAPPEPPAEAMQQDVPGWIQPVATAELARERMLRASLRRLRHLLERCGTAGLAADAYLAEPDVAAIE